MYVNPRLCLTLVSECMVYFTVKGLIMMASPPFIAFEVSRLRQLPEPLPLDHCVIMVSSNSMIVREFYFFSILPQLQM
jgi:hypothetical protein